MTSRSNNSSNWSFSALGSMPSLSYKSNAHGSHSREPEEVTSHHKRAHESSSRMSIDSHHFFHHAGSHGTSHPLSQDHINKFHHFDNQPARSSHHHASSGHHHTSSGHHHTSSGHHHTSSGYHHTSSKHHHSASNRHDSSSKATKHNAPSLNQTGTTQRVFNFSDLMSKNTQNQAQPVSTATNLASRSSKNTAQPVNNFSDLVSSSAKSKSQRVHTFNDLVTSGSQSKRPHISPAIGSVANSSQNKGKEISTFSGSAQTQSTKNKGKQVLSLSEQLPPISNLSINRGSSSTKQPKYLGPIDPDKHPWCFFLKHTLGVNKDEINAKRTDLKTLLFRQPLMSIDQNLGNLSPIEKNFKTQLDEASFFSKKNIESTVANFYTDLAYHAEKQGYASQNPKLHAGSYIDILNNFELPKTQSHHEKHYNSKAEKLLSRPWSKLLYPFFKDRDSQSQLDASSTARAERLLTFVNTIEQYGNGSAVFGPTFDKQYPDTNLDELASAGWIVKNGAGVSLLRRMSEDERLLDVTEYNLVKRRLVNDITNAFSKLRKKDQSSDDPLKVASYIYDYSQLLSSGIPLEALTKKSIINQYSEKVNNQYTLNLRKNEPSLLSMDSNLKSLLEKVWQSAMHANNKNKS